MVEMIYGINQQPMTQPGSVGLHAVPPSSPRSSFYPRLLHSSLVALADSSCPQLTDRPGVGGGRGTN